MSQIDALLDRSRAPGSFVERRKFTLSRDKAIGKLRIESGDGHADSTVRIDLDRKGRGVLGIPEEGLAGTYISAEFGLGWFDRFGDGDPTAEEELIEERCRYSPVPILLNGRAPFGYRASRQLSMVGCPHYLSFDDGVATGSSPCRRGSPRRRDSPWWSAASASPPWTCPSSSASSDCSLDSSATRVTEATCLFCSASRRLTSPSCERVPPR